jgi:hypothetical protein
MTPGFSNVPLSFLRLNTIFHFTATSPVFMLKALFKRIIGLYMNISFRRWLKQDFTHIGSGF